MHIFFIISYLNNEYFIKLQHQPKQQSERSVRFWCNFHGFKQLLAQEIPKCLCIKIIQGCVGLAQCEIKTQQKQQIVYILIALRETLRGGTRYNHRGLNNEGAAANTVETEQLIQYQEKLYCHLQIRGSVPVFWEQVGIRAISQITQNNEQTKLATTKHLMILKKYFGSLLLIDLMAVDKPNEALISQTIKMYILNRMINQIKVSQFYINKQILNNIVKIINLKAQPLNQLKQRHFNLIILYQILEWKIMSNFYIFKQVNFQKGIVRANCLDCLDRTNVIQTKIAFFITNILLNDLGIDILTEFGCETILDLVKLTYKYFSQIKIKYMILQNQLKYYGESGDNISRIYAGTDSSTTKIQKTGGNK